MIVMDDHLAAILRPTQLLAKCRHLRAAAEVIELEWTAACAAQVADHGQDRRDPNAAGDEEIAGWIAGEGKIVPGRGHQKLVAGLPLIDQINRSPSAIRFALHCDDVAIALVWIVAKRIAADKPVWRLNEDMGASLKRRQIRSVRVDKFEELDVLSDPGRVLHLHGPHLDLVKI